MCYNELMNKTKRLIGYIDETDHRRLKARLAVQGLTFREWIVRVVRLELEGKLIGGGQSSRVVLREQEEDQP